MPATRYDYQTSSYRIACQECGTVAHATSAYDENANDQDRPGQLVSETFRWLRGPYRWQYLCRSCEREYNRQRRAARPRTGSRVPGMTRAALGIARSFGVELECILPSHVTRAQVISALQDAGLPAADRASGTSYWSVKGDGSLTGGNGLEIVSPPLAGEAGEDAVRVACRALRGLGATVNRSCGTHVHHDVNDLTVDEIKSAATSWFNNQDLIDGLVSPSRRADANGYCRRLTSDDMARINAVRDLSQMRSVYLDRYRTLNLTSYGRHGTLEVRQHQGTLDAEKIISWLRLGQAIIDSAKTSGVAARQSSVRDLLAAMGSALNETARTFLLGRAVEFNAVAV